MAEKDRVSYLMVLLLWAPILLYCRVAAMAFVDMAIASLLVVLRPPFFRRMERSLDFDIISRDKEWQ